MPDGRKKQVQTDLLSPELEAKHNELIAKGCRAEIEVLSTGIISAAYEYKDVTVAMVLSTNGPELGKRLEELVLGACEVVDDKIANYDEEVNDGG
jgi:hypothetical protein